MANDIQIKYISTHSARLQIITEILLMVGGSFGSPCIVRCSNLDNKDEEGHVGTFGKQFTFQYF